MGICKKKTYGSQQGAMKALHRINSSGQLDKKLTAAYYCYDHGGWHLTSEDLRSRQYRNGRR